MSEYADESYGNSQYATLSHDHAHSQGEKIVQNYIKTETKFASCESRFDHSAENLNGSFAFSTNAIKEIHDSIDYQENSDIKQSTSCIDQSIYTTNKYSTNATVYLEQSNSLPPFKAKYPVPESVGQRKWLPQHEESLDSNERSSRNSDQHLIKLTSTPISFRGFQNFDLSKGNAEFSEASLVIDTSMSDSRSLQDSNDFQMQPLGQVHHNTPNMNYEQKQFSTVSSSQFMVQNDSSEPHLDHHYSAHDPTRPSSMSPPITVNTDNCASQLQGNRQLCHPDQQHFIIDSHEVAAPPMESANVKLNCYDKVTLPRPLKQ